MVLWGKAYSHFLSPKPVHSQWVYFNYLRGFFPNTHDHFPTIVLRRHSGKDSFGCKLLKSNLTNLNIKKHRTSEIPGPDTQDDTFLIHLFLIFGSVFLYVDFFQSQSLLSLWGDIHPQLQHYILPVQSCPVKRQCIFPSSSSKSAGLLLVAQCLSLRQLFW